MSDLEASEVMQELADRTAGRLHARVDVEAVVVVVMGGGGAGMGVRVPSDVPFDTIIGCVVQLLGVLRQKLAKAAFTEVPRGG